MSDLPQGWTLTPLTEIVRRARRTVEVEPEQLYYQIGIRSHGIGIFHKEPVTGKEIGNKRIYWLEPGDFVLNIVFAWEGAVALVSEEEKGWVGSHRFPTFVANRKKCDPRFLLRYFQTKRGVFDLGLVSPGGAGRNKTLNQSDFLNLEIKLPPIKEQSRICDIIDTWDEAITLIERLIAALQQRKKGLMQRLLTGEVRKSWEIKRLGDIATILLSNVDKKTDKSELPVRLCNFMDVFNYNYITNDMAFMRASANQREIDKFTLIPNDVILTKDSETAEDIAQTAVVVEELDNVVCGYHLAVLRPDSTQVFGPFLREMLVTPDVHYQFEKFANGVTRYGLTQSSLGNVKVPIPSLETQRKIYDVFRSLDQLLDGLLEYGEQLKSQKKGLMQRLLTGEVRVGVDE